MFVIDASSPKESQRNDGTIRQLQTSIKASSPFTAENWICFRCEEKNSVKSSNCLRDGCHQEFDWSSTILDQRGRILDPARFPVYWLCSTCCVPHYLLEILQRKPTCACGRPTLQAIYDQFGDLFLFWQHDPAIQDLRDPAKIREAARRLWAASGDRWAEQMPMIMLQDIQRTEQVEEMPMLSHSVLST